MNKHDNHHSSKATIFICNLLKITLIFVGLLNLLLTGYFVNQKELFMGFLCLLGGLYPIGVYIQYYGKKIS